MSDYLRVLKAELLDDPARRGYMAAADDQIRADLLNTEFTTVPAPVAAPVDCKVLEAALMQTAIPGAGGMVIWDLIEAAALGDDNPLTGQPFPAALRFPLVRVHRWVTQHPVIDLSLPATQALIAGLVAASLLTQAQADALAGLGYTQPPGEWRPARIHSITHTPKGEPPPVATADDVTAALALE